VALRLVITNHNAYCILTEKGEPSTFEDVLNILDAFQWMEEMHEEMKSLHRNNTWEIVEL